jgi:hypothetical protein
MRGSVVMGTPPRRSQMSDALEVMQPHISSLWLEKAMRLRDPALVYLKTDPLMDALRNEPRFQAVMRELKFPD